MNTRQLCPTSRRRQTGLLSNMTLEHQSHANARRHTTSQGEDRTRPAFPSQPNTLSKATRRDTPDRPCREKKRGNLHTTNKTQRARNLHTQTAQGFTLPHTTYR